MACQRCGEARQHEGKSLRPIWRRPSTVEMRSGRRRQARAASAGGAIAYSTIQMVHPPAGLIAPHKRQAAAQAKLFFPLSARRRFRDLRAVDRGVKARSNTAGAGEKAPGADARPAAAHRRPARSVSAEATSPVAAPGLLSTPSTPSVGCKRVGSSLAHIPARGSYQGRWPSRTARPWMVDAPVAARLHMLLLSCSPAH